MTYPPDFTLPEEKWMTAHVAASKIGQLASEHRGVVQAGGCAGLWPVTLSATFAQVYTFEPEPVNFACLTANIAACANVTARQAAVGDRPAYVGLTRPKVGAGLWRVDGVGTIPMVRIDDAVGDAPIDAIVLDVEGAEVAALRGAERVIAAYRPVLWFEFLHHQGELHAFLAAHGYQPPRRGIGGDYASVSTIH